MRLFPRRFAWITPFTWLALAPSAPAAAPAQRTPQETAARILELARHGQLSHAYDAAGWGTAQFPDAPEVQAAAALIYVQLFYREAAEKAARAALAKEPNNAAAHSVLGELLAREGKVEEAVRELRQAANDPSTGAGAREDIADLETQARVLRSPMPAPAEGTPERTAREFIEAVRAEALPRAFGHVTADLRTAIEGKLGPIDGKKVAGFSRGLAQSFLRQRARLLGYALDAVDTKPADPQTRRVRATLVLESQLDPKGIDMILRFAKQPAIKSLLEPQLAQILSGVEGGHQRAFLERVSGQPLRRLVAWFFELRLTGTQWKLDDIREAGDAPRTFRDLLVALPQIEREVERAEGGRRSPFRTGELVGQLVGILLVVAGLVWYVLRQRRKTRLDPPPPRNPPQ